MNLKKKMRRGSLAALITLALTSSALAMPAGGVVQSGDVNIGGSTDFSTVANGATITAGTDSTINWNTFNIGSGETLNFNIAGGKLLLNQVTGAQASEILGTMNQTGKGSLALVNPNGIHIGGDAVLDVNTLTLSTLGIVTQNDTETLIREGALGARAITVDQGAQFDIARRLNLFGGKVSVADGVVFNLNDVPNPQESMLEVVAAKELYWQEGADHDSALSKWTMERDNTVDFHGRVNALSTGKDAEINIFGYAVNADRAHIDGDRAAISIAAWTKLTSDDRNNAPIKTTKVELSPENVVRADGLRIREKKSTEIRGGKVELKNSTINSARLDITAHNSFHTTGDMDVSQRHEVLTATADNSVALDNVTVKGKENPNSYHWFEITGGTVNIANSSIQTDKGVKVSALSSLDRTMVKYPEKTPIEMKGTRQGSSANTLTLKNSKLVVETSTLSGNEPNDTYLYGGKVTAADDVTIHLHNAANHASGLMIIGGNHWRQEYNANAVEVLREYRGAQGNDVAFHGTVKCTGDGEAFVGIGGFAVNADRAKLHGDRTEFALTAFTKEDYDQTAPRWQDYWETTERSAANTVQTDGLEVRGDKELYIDGGSVTLQNSDIKIGALTLVADQKEKGDGDTEVGNLVHEYKKAGTDNVVYLSNVKVHRPTVDNGYNTTTIYGGKVNIEKSDIAARGRTLIGAGAEQKYTYGSQSAYLDEAAADNVLSVKDSTFRFDRSKEYHASFGGGKAIFDGVTMTRNKEINLVVGNKMDEQNGGATKFEVTKDNELGLWNSTVEADEINIGAGQIGVWKDSKIAAGNILAVNSAAHVTRTDGSTASLLRDASSHVTAAGTESTAFTVKSADQPAPPAPEPPAPPVPTPQPEPPKPVPTPELSKNDKANMESGKKAVAEALSKNASQENRIAALTDVVADLNAKASRRQSAGVVVGIVQEIENAATLSDGEKVALVESVLNAYAPVREAKAEQDNTATNTIDEAVDAAANVSAAPVYPDETEAEDVVSFA